MAGKSPGRDFGSGGSRVYIVESVRDPDQAGWYQLRDPVRHKGIPKEKLPWGQAATEGAAHQGVGVSPNSKYLVGSHVYGDTSDAMGLSPVIRYAANKAGDTKSGSSVDGGSVTNKETNSVAKAARDDPGDEQEWLDTDPPGTEVP